MVRPSKLENLRAALKQFEEFAAVKNPTRIEIAGIIQGFEFTLEVFWKYF